MLATGFAYDAAVRRAQAEVVARLLPRVRDVRRIGSAALDLAWLAAGRYDAFYERGVNVGRRRRLAAVRRAGLAVRELEPSPPAAGGVVVAPPGADRRARIVCDAEPRVGRTRDMIIVTVVAFCVRCYPRLPRAALSRHPERGGQKVLGFGSRGAGKAPGARPLAEQAVPDLPEGGLQERQRRPPRRGKMPL